MFYAGDIKANLFNAVFATLVVYNTMLFGYGLGVQISNAILGSHAQSAPRTETNFDDYIGIYIPVDHLEISKPPVLAEKTVTVSCTGPDGKQFQTSPEACNSLTTAWKN